MTTQQITRATEAYCNAWLASFAKANPYHTVSMTDDDISHIDAGVRAALQAQDAAWQTLSKQIQEAAIASGQKQRPRENNQGIASDAWLHPIGTCSPERDGENQHHEHRAGEPDAKCADCKCDSECTRVSSGDKVRVEQVTQPTPPAGQREAAAEPAAAWENKYGMKEWQVHALRAGWSPQPAPDAEAIRLALSEDFVGYMLVTLRRQREQLKGFVSLGNELSRAKAIDRYITQLEAIAALEKVNHG